MLLRNRRSILVLLAGLLPWGVARAQTAPASGQARFVEQAFAIQRIAIERGDQSYGAIVVRGEEIVGLGPSGVIVRKDATAHAEREAIRDAQRKLGQADLSGCMMYSTSRPCSDCERAAAQANIARMYFGANATDAGAPRKS